MANQLMRTEIGTIKVPEIVEVIDNRLKMRIQRKPFTAEDKLINFIGRRKPVLLLLKLGMQKDKKPNFGSKLSKDIDCTYSHATKILKQLKELGYIDLKRKGRIKEITLTSSGRGLVENLQRLYR